MYCVIFSILDQRAIIVVNRIDRTRDTSTRPIRARAKTPVISHPFWALQSTTRAVRNTLDQVQHPICSGRHFNRAHTAHRVSREHNHTNPSQKTPRENATQTHPTHTSAGRFFCIGISARVSLNMHYACTHILYFRTTQNAL